MFSISSELSRFFFDQPIGSALGPGTAQGGYQILPQKICPEMLGMYVLIRVELDLK